MVRHERVASGAAAFVLAVVAAFLPACRQRSEPEPITWYEDVKPIVDARCSGCHREGGIAPFPLRTYEDVLAHKDEVRHAVATRIMPPWPPAKDCGTFRGERALTDEQVDAIVTWADRGAPGGSPSDEAPPLETDVASLSRVDYRLPIPAPYTPRQAPDEYRCFVIDWPTSTRYVTGFRASPGATEMVHHVIAYVAPPSALAELRTLEAEDPEPGYTCFGGPRANIGTSGWLGAWAPGGLGSDFPAGTGIKVEAGSKLIVQVHYNVEHGTSRSDQTAIELKVDDSVTQEAVVLPWAKLEWLTKRTMHIPAGAPDVVHSHEVDFTLSLGRLTGGVVPSHQPFTLYGSALHMHTRGRSASLRIRRAGGAGEECLLDIPRWDFHWQGFYEYRQPITIHPGDVLILECHWNNSAEAQPVRHGVRVPPRDLNWGDGTDDEMCMAVIALSR